MTPSIGRLTLYALISAIEDDLRRAIESATSDLSAEQVFGEQLLLKVSSRFTANRGKDSAPSVAELLSYCDYGDAIHLSRTHKQLLARPLNDLLSKLNSEINHLVSTRNRVMHSRPLEFDDLARTAELCDVLVTEPAHWPALSAVRKRLSSEPEMPLRLSIPREAETSSVSHNLPLPDFDETGFIGRKSTVTNLKKAVLGVYPVVTIVGEGGLGKTSLALKVAYELLDEKSDQFDAIIFVTAKTQRLGDAEIVRIKDAVNSSIGLMGEASRALGGGEEEDKLEELIELLTEFKVLLIVDNLETVIDQNIRQLLERIPRGSKIVITTRVRVGAFEYPIQLEPLHSSESTQLLRATAKVRECAKLVKLSDSRLQEYCSKMRNNPLHIKWFVSAVQSGQRPETVLSDERMFLQFCLSNVFNMLSDDGRKLVRTLQSLGGSYTVAELEFLTALGDTALLKAIAELTRSNMFFSISNAVGSSFETKYELSQLARAYLSRFYPVRAEEQQKLLAHKKKLISAGEQFSSEARLHPLSASAIHCRSRSDWVVAKFLKDALTCFKSGNRERAAELIERAKTLAPDFSEVHRIEAYVLTQIGDITGAYDCYGRAVDLAPKSPLNRYVYGAFLLKDFYDTDAAKVQFQVAMDLAPDLHDPKIEYARCCLYVREFEQAEATIIKLETAGNLSQNHINRVQDVHLQLYIRRADYFCVARNFSEALNELRRAREYFLNVRTPDNRLIEKLEKALVTIGQVRAAYSGMHAVQRELGDMVSWIEGLSNGRGRA